MRTSPDGSLEVLDPWKTTQHIDDFGQTHTETHERWVPLNRVETQPAGSQTETFTSGEASQATDRSYNGRTDLKNKH